MSTKKDHRRKNLNLGFEIFFNVTLDNGTVRKFKLCCDRLSVEEKDRIDENVVEVAGAFYKILQPYLDIIPDEQVEGKRMSLEEIAIRQNEKYQKNN